MAPTVNNVRNLFLKPTEEMLSLLRFSILCEAAFVILAALVLLLAESRFETESQ
jgi:hypothetical protein